MKKLTAALTTLIIASIMLLSACSPQQSSTKPAERAMPNASTQQVLDFAQTVIQQLIAIDSTNHSQQLTKLKPYFTEGALEDYEINFKEHHLFSVMQFANLRVRTSPNLRIRINHTTVRDDVFTWDISALPTVYFYNDEVSFPFYYRIHLLVQHAPKNQGVNGLIVAGMLVR